MGWPRSTGARTSADRSADRPASAALSAFASRTTAWPVGFHHFPRIAPVLWNMCGMGPITRDVAGARAVVRALSGSLRRPFPSRRIDPEPRRDLGSRRAASRGVAHVRGGREAASRRRTVGWVVSRDLPDAHRDQCALHAVSRRALRRVHRDGRAPARAGDPVRVSSRSLSGGRLNRRVHPNTALLLLPCFAMRARALRQGARGGEGGGCPATRLCHLGLRRAHRLADDDRSSASARTRRDGSPLDELLQARQSHRRDGPRGPFGTFFPGTPAFPRSLRILGPPGSEEAILDLGARLERG